MLSPYVILPVGIMAISLVALPFFGDAMGQFVWMSDSIRAWCGF